MNLIEFFRNSIGILTVSLLCASCGPKVALSSFKDLPKEISVETIGNRVAEQLLAADPLDYGNNLPGYQAPYNYGRGGKEMNYSVVSLWVNAIEFAHRSHNKKLEKRFWPLRRDIAGMLKRIHQHGVKKVTGLEVFATF